MYLSRQELDELNIPMKDLRYLGRSITSPLVQRKLKVDMLLIASINMALYGYSDMWSGQVLGMQHNGAFFKVFCKPSCVGTCLNRYAECQSEIFVTWDNFGITEYGKVFVERFMAANFSGEDDGEYQDGEDNHGQHATEVKVGDVVTIDLPSGEYDALCQIVHIEGDDDIYMYIVESNDIRDAFQVIYSVKRDKIFADSDGDLHIVMNMGAVRDALSKVWEGKSHVL